MFALAHMQVLWKDCGEARVPAELEDNPYFPAANATEVLFMMFKILCNPAQEMYRELLKILKDPLFNVCDIPSYDDLNEMIKRLPLVQGYSHCIGKYDSFYTTNNAHADGEEVLIHGLRDVLDRVEHNQTQLSAMHWGAEWVRTCLTIIFNLSIVI